MVTASCEDELVDVSKVSYKGTKTITETNVGEYSEAIDITKASYTDNNLTVTFEAGTPVKFKIEQKPVTITINGSSDTKTYTGEPLTSNTTVTPSCGDSLFDATKFSYSGTATITMTEVGKSSVAIDIEKASYDDENLDVTFVAGTPVTFAINPKAVTITANSNSWTYDGAAHTEAGFTATALEEGDEHEFTVVMTEESTITNVGTQPNVIATVDGEAVETGVEKAIGNYLVTTVDGELEIKKDTAELVITSATNSWTYDSKLHKDETYTVTYNGETVAAGEDGKTFTLANGDVITITATAAGVTNVADNAEKNNTYTYTVKHGDTDTSGNYETITANVGTLTINPKAVTITANSNSWTYDGAAHTEAGFTATALEEGDAP